MNVAVIYCYPLVQPARYYPLAKRFADTWRKYPPQSEHALYVGFNGGVAGPIHEQLFAGIPHSAFPHDNTGWDIGLYQRAADNLPCDLLVCLGSHSHFHRSGWLEKMIDAYVEHGPNLYGCRGYFYPAGHGHHLRTTSFWMPPEILQSYPYLIGNDRLGRYGFEHGRNNFTQWVEMAGMKALVATWDGVFEVEQWKDGFGPESTSLVLDQWTHFPGSTLDRMP